MKYLIFIIILLQINIHSQWLLFDDEAIVYDGTELITDAIDRDLELSNILNGFDFTSGWSTTTGVTINTASQFTSTGSGGVYKSHTVTGTKYKTTIAGTTNASSFAFYDYISATRYSNFLESAFSQTFTFTAVGTTIYGRNGGAGTTNLTTWALTKFPNYTTTGNHSFDSTSTYKQAGSYGGKIVATDAGNGTTNTISLASALFTAVTSGSYYRLQLYAYTSTASTTLTFKLGDITLTSVVSTVGMSVINFDFTATASTTGNILLYLDKAATVYIDDLSLKSGQ